MHGRRRAILEHLRSAPDCESTRADLLRIFPSGDEHRLDVTLCQLSRRGEIVRVSRGRWRLPASPPTRPPKKKPPPRKKMPRRPPKPKPPPPAAAAPPPPTVCDVPRKLAALERVIYLLRVPPTRDRAALAASLSDVANDVARISGIPRPFGGASRS